MKSNQNIFFIIFSFQQNKRYPNAYYMYYFQIIWMPWIWAYGFGLRAQIQNLWLANLKEIDLDLAQIQLVFDKSKTINLKSGGI